MTYYEYTYRVEKYLDFYVIREYKILFFDDYVKYQKMDLVSYAFINEPILFETEEDALHYISINY